MDFRHLHYFTTVAKQQSFTKAAHKLHVSQPSLSKMVKALEDELGVTLIDRSGKQIQLTDAGMIVYKEATTILHSLYDLSNSLYDLMNLKKGKIKIGIPPIVGTLFFPTIIKSFRDAYPDIVIEMIEFGGAKVTKMVEVGEVDVGVIVLPIEENIFDITKLGGEPMKVVIHEDHPLSDQESLSLLDLKDDSFIIFHEDFAMHDIIYKECIKHGFAPNVAYKSSQWDFIAEMVAANLGVALFPTSICRKLYQPSLKIKELKNYIPWQLAVITRKNRYISFATKTFIKHTVEAFQTGHN
ncbi:LysR family transcriptional regulator [Priestia endophytica]|jgi:DNA-binding transcriptional LysR family regulator|uniref:LysR family transcriptional regulator n=1 Tax=Priestia endophytica TaxID=135735 RepID=UPI000DCA7DE4|nr:LysR family transcriptional regulator [Priestia endophytica]RAS74028.1 LysR family transcriptional regulator [Priestia endophytica]RPK12777.1 hypothetical protein FH5_02983 [Priestia endophytica]